MLTVNVCVFILDIEWDSEQETNLPAAAHNIISQCTFDKRVSASLLSLTATLHSMISRVK